MPFAIRKFDTAKPLGETLKTLRKAARLTLAELETKTKIRRCYLEALEKSDYGSLPEPLYTRKFVKTYVNALGGNEKYFLERYEEERGTCDLVALSRLPRARVRPIQFLVGNRFAKICTLALVGAGLLTYLGFQMHAIVSSPEIILLTPQDGQTTKEAVVLVSGQVADGVRVKVNEENVLLGAQGNFEQEVALKRGLNLITINATKRYSRANEIYRRVVFEQHE